MCEWLIGGTCRDLLLGWATVVVAFVLYAGWLFFFGRCICGHRHIGHPHRR